MIKKIEDLGKRYIDLTGPEGNAFCLMGIAQSFNKQLGKNKEESQSIMDDMKSSDYEHLVDVFEKHYGDFVDLYR
jgi:hypothetical protein